MEGELTALLDTSPRMLDADTELMLRFQAGETECFDRLVSRFRAPLHAFVTRMVRDREHSEEIIQEAFLRVYLHRERYRPQARFSTWLYRIASHLALNHLRDHRHDRRALPLDAPVAAGDEAPSVRELADGRRTSEQLMLDEERREVVRRAIAALPARQQAAVVMHKYQGLDYEQIAGALDLSESATKSLLFRAYERLRRELRELI